MKKLIVVLAVVGMTGCGLHLPPWPFPQPTPTPAPTPAPTPTPTPEPTPEPTPTPTPTPEPTPTPTPAPAACPARLPDISAQTVNARCMNLSPTGKCRTDATGRVGDRGNDEGYCGVVTGNPAIHSCKVNPEGAGLTGCDEQFWQAKCALWFYSVDGGHSWKRCLPDGDGATGEFSCDHFDDYTDTAGPYTGTCERGPSGGPITGYHMVPHGKGKVRACKADESVCSDPLDINY